MLRHVHGIASGIVYVEVDDPDHCVSLLDVTTGRPLGAIATTAEEGAQFALTALDDSVYIAADLDGDADVELAAFAVRA